VEEYKKKAFYINSVILTFSFLSSPLGYGHLSLLPIILRNNNQVRKEIEKSLEDRVENH